MDFTSSHSFYFFNNSFASSAHAFVYFKQSTFGTEHGIVAPKHFVDAKKGRTTPEAQQYTRELETLYTETELARLKEETQDQLASPDTFNVNRGKPLEINDPLYAGKGVLEILEINCKVLHLAFEAYPSLCEVAYVHLMRNLAPTIDANVVILGKKGQWKGSTVQLENGKVTVTHPDGRTASCMIFPYFEAPQVQDEPDIIGTPLITPDPILPLLPHASAPIDEEITGDTGLPDRVVPPWEEGMVLPPQPTKTSGPTPVGGKLERSTDALGKRKYDPITSRELGSSPPLKIDEKRSDLGFKTTDSAPITEEVLDNAPPLPSAPEPTVESAGETQEDTPSSPEQAIQAVFQEMLGDFARMTNLDLVTIFFDYPPIVTIIHANGNVSGFKITLTPNDLSEAEKKSPMEALITVGGAPIPLPPNDPIAIQHFLEALSTHNFKINGQPINHKIEKFLKANPSAKNVKNYHLKIVFLKALEMMNIPTINASTNTPPPAPAQ